MDEGEERKEEIEEERAAEEVTLLEADVELTVEGLVVLLLLLLLLFWWIWSGGSNKTLGCLIRSPTTFLHSSDLKSTPMVDWEISSNVLGPRWRERKERISLWSFLLDAASEKRLKNCVFEVSSDWKPEAVKPSPKPPKPMPRPNGSKEDMNKREDENEQTHREQSEWLD